VWRDLFNRASSVEGSAIKQIPPLFLSHLFFIFFKDHSPGLQGTRYTESKVPKLTTSRQKHEGGTKLPDPVKDDSDAGGSLKNIQWHPAEP
jgi:hypothetical protein